MLNLKQQEALNLALKGSNILLEGKAGTGKSFTVKEIIRNLKNKGKKVVILGSTGIAASNIGGETFHSFFSIKPFGILTKEDANYVKNYKREMYSKVDTIIVDEISMLRPDIFDTAIETMLKNNIDIKKKQWILLGDFKQLNPILTKDSEKVFYALYKENNIKSSNYFNLLNFQVLELTKVERQNNPIFINALNCIRDNRETNYFKRFEGKKPQGVVICSTNKVVDKINNHQLSLLKGDLIHIKGDKSSNYKDSDTVAVADLYLKDGCEVMYLRNNDNLVNGNIGVYYFQNGKHTFEYKGNVYYLQKERFGKYSYNEKLELELVSFIDQLPIKVCYALTVHKSQGLTFEQVTIDYSDKFFEEGQEYVALSRVTTPSGLSIINKR